MPYELLQCRNSHVLIRLMSSKRVTQRVNAYPFADAGLFDIFATIYFTVETFNDVPFFARNKISSSKQVDLLDTE